MMFSPEFARSVNDVARARQESQRQQLAIVQAWVREHGEITPQHWIQKPRGDDKGLTKAEEKAHRTTGTWALRDSRPYLENGAVLLQRGGMSQYRLLLSAAERGRLGGLKGGKKTTKAKRFAAWANGRKGGRPAKPKANSPTLD